MRNPLTVSHKWGRTKAMTPKNVGNGLLYQAALIPKMRKVQHGSATIDHIKVATARDPNSPGDFISQTNDETAGQTLATQQVSSHPAPQKIHECSRELATACNQAGHDVVDGPRGKRAAR